MYSRDLFTIPAPTSRSAEPCCDKDTLTCYDVDVDPDSLLSEEDLTMNGVTLKFSNYVPPNARVYTTSEGDEAIISYNKNTGNIIGTLKTHDGKAFALEKCGNGYIFEEFDVESFPSEKENEHEGLLTEDSTRAIDSNMTMDRNEIATYSIMVYYTPEFAATTPNIEDFVDQVSGNVLLYDIYKLMCRLLLKLTRDISTAKFLLESRHIVLSRLQLMIKTVPPKS